MDDIMHTENEIPAPTSDDVMTHARDAADAMRAAGTERPDIERALIDGAERHARFVGSFHPPEVEK